MSILDKIVAFKRDEVFIRQKSTPVEKLKESPYYSSSCQSLENALLRSKTGIIAEFKRKSPSRQNINVSANPDEIVSDYDTNGASGISVLTDMRFFGAQQKDFDKARSATTLPILRKEFIIDPYQVIESKAMGADAILLIGAVLSFSDSKVLADQAVALGMEVVYEIRNPGEIAKVPISATIIGVNNRNLNTFQVDYRHSLKILKDLPSHKTKISESGLSNSAAICTLRDVGYHGFLIGEFFMKDNKPGHTLAWLISECKK